ncbi:DUF4139 domain-containing protein [Luteimonas pelagia]
MNRSLIRMPRGLVLPFALSGALVACNNVDAPDAPPQRPVAPEAAAPDGGGNAPEPRAASHLTIFSGDYAQLASGGSGGFAQVRSELTYALQSGANSIAVGDLPRGVDVAAVSLRPSTQGVDVGAQRFLAPFDSAESVLARAIGRRVSVEHSSGGAKQTDSGTLVAAGDAITLALADGRYKLIREYDSLSVLEAGDLPGAEPTLRWQVTSPQAGNANFLLSYPTTGLSWRAEYVARLAKVEDGCQLALDGWAMVANRSGVGYPNAQLTLVAGEPERATEDARKFRAAPAPAAAPEMDMAQGAMPTRRRAGEYHAYDLPGHSTLADGAIERVPLFTRAEAVACQRSYVTGPAGEPWQPPRPLLEPGYDTGTGAQPVKAVVEIANSEDTGLGRPLPEGRIRVFDGDEFLGESQQGHTPAGAELRMEVGTAFDLTAERERVAFAVDREGRTMTESFRVTVRNARDADVVVTVVEPMGRWSDWALTESSIEGTRRDAQHAEFEVPVPTGGETVLAYTVRYSWPRGMTP